MRTVNHLGDTLMLSCAMWNAKQVLSDVGFTYSGQYGAVFERTGLVTAGTPEKSLYVRYKNFGVKDNAAPLGNLCEGMTVNLGRHLGAEIPCARKTPFIVLDEKEKHGDFLKGLDGRPYVVMNTNCQDKSTVKAYPFWNEVVEMLPETVFVLSGGRESRDRRSVMKAHGNMVDLRGQTSIREFFALVEGSVGAVSPSSSLVHVAAAFGKPIVCMTGASEPTKFTDYPRCVRLSNACFGKRLYDGTYGCRHFDAKAGSCEKIVEMNGVSYADCMTRIPPEAVADAIRMMAGGGIR